LFADICEEGANIKVVVGKEGRSEVFWSSGILKLKGCRKYSRKEEFHFV
jgi:hypothetical protein